MGKFQQLRAKALSIRGALAIGGAVVVAASMTQVAGTLAAPVAVRTAKLGVATANYFPTPLPTSISCRTNTSGDTGAIISWASAGVGMRYRVLVLRGNSSNDVQRDFYTSALSYRYTADGIASDRVRVYTVNTSSGNTSAEWVTSSGFVSHTTYSTSSAVTRCSGDPRYDSPNQTWENQRDWTPEASTFAFQPEASMSTTLMDTLNSDEVLEPLPEAVELPAVPSAPASDSETSIQTGTTSSPTTSAAPSAPKSTPPATSATTSKPTSATRSTTPDLTSTTAATTRTSSPSASAPPSSTTATTAPPRRAGVGDGPIAVGTQYARLDEVDGQPLLVITTGGGGKVCTVEVPGATRIDSAAGELTVTVAGRTRSVDTATCAIG